MTDIELKLRRAIDKYDKIMHPYLFFMHPDDYKSVPKDFSEYKYIYPNEGVQKGKVIALDRNAMYEWTKPNLWGLKIDDEKEN